MAAPCRQAHTHSLLLPQQLLDIDTVATPKERFFCVSKRCQESRETRCEQPLPARAAKQLLQMNGVFVLEEISGIFFWNFFKQSHLCVPSVEVAFTAERS